MQKLIDNNTYHLQEVSLLLDWLSIWGPRAFGLVCTEASIRTLSGTFARSLRLGLTHNIPKHSC